MHFEELHFKPLLVLNWFDIQNPKWIAFTISDKFACLISILYLDKKTYCISRMLSHLDKYIHSSVSFQTVPTHFFKLKLHEQKKSRVKSNCLGFLAVLLVKKSRKEEFLSFQPIARQKHENNLHYNFLLRAIFVRIVVALENC